jgi:hypothetical protein
MPELRNMWKRYQDQDQARTNLLGFFDELIAVVDEDGSGNVSVEEFRPIWNILRDAQLTNVDLPDESQLWQPLKELLKDALAASPKHAKVVESLQGSTWNDPVCLRIRRAGRRFVNVIWDDRLLASIVTAKRFPLQIYVEVRNPAEFIAANSDLSAFLESAETGHFGIGNIEVVADRLAELESDARTAFFNELHRRLLAEAGAR